VKKAALELKIPKLVEIREFVKKWLTPILTAVIVLVLAIVSLIVASHKQKDQNTPSGTSIEVIQSTDNIVLPQTDVKSSNSIEAVLKNRRIKLDFNDSSLSLKQIAQLLWAAQGINTDWGDRTSPSMKSTYPLTVYLIANKVDGLDAGEYQYLPGDRTPLNQLKPIKKVELGESIYDLLNQSSFKDVPAIFVVTGNLNKMADAYGGIPHDKEVYLEAGFAAENLALQAESLKLGTVVNTNFDELKLKELVTVADTDTIIYLMPVGYPR